MKLISNLFNTDRHLTEEEIALWVDALAESRTINLPKNLTKHVDHCMSCKASIVEIRHMVRDLNLPDIQPVLEPVIIRRNFFSTTTLIRLAAVIIVLIAVGATIALYIFNRQHNTDKLFSQNFSPYPDLVTEKGGPIGNDTARQLMYLGFSYYQKSNFDSAAIVFRHLYENNPASDTVAFYLANAVLATDQSPEKAIEILSNLSSKNVFKDQATWYLALAFIKKHKVEIARKQLLILIATSRDYQERAKELLEEIN